MERCLPGCLLVVMLLAALHEAVFVWTCLSGPLDVCVCVCFALTRTELHPFSPLTSVWGFCMTPLFL